MLNRRRDRRPRSTAIRNNVKWKNRKISFSVIRLPHSSPPPHPAPTIRRQICSGNCSRSARSFTKTHPLHILSNYRNPVNNYFVVVDFMWPLAPLCTYYNNPSKHFELLSLTTVIQIVWGKPASGRPTVFRTRIYITMRCCATCDDLRKWVSHERIILQETVNPSL